jgi:hypothetical protein
LGRKRHLRDGGAELRQTQVEELIICIDLMSMAFGGSYATVRSLSSPSVPRMTLTKWVCVVKAINKCRYACVEIC